MTEATTKCGQQMQTANKCTVSKYIINEYMTSVIDKLESVFETESVGKVLEFFLTNLWKLRIRSADKSVS